MGGATGSVAPGDVAGRLTTRDDAQRFATQGVVAAALPPGHRVGRSMPLPERLEKVVRRFATAPRELRVQALLQQARKVPPLPTALEQDRDRMEQVHECMTPFFLATELEGDAVRIHFDCPPESPTVRGFAGILWSGLDGATPEVILSVPSHFYVDMRLHEVVSPQRLQGFAAILTRLKRQVGRLANGAEGSGGSVRD